MIAPRAQGMHTKLPRQVIFHVENKTTTLPGIPKMHQANEMAVTMETVFFEAFDIVLWYSFNIWPLAQNRCGRCGNRYFPFASGSRHWGGFSLLKSIEIFSPLQLHLFLLHIPVFFLSGWYAWKQMFYSILAKWDKLLKALAEAEASPEGLNSPVVCWRIEEPTKATSTLCPLCQKVLAIVPTNGEGMRAGHQRPSGRMGCQIQGL